MPLSSALRRPAAIVLGALLSLQTLPALAQNSGSFKDVSSKHPALAAIEFVKAQNIMGGNPDGTFRPDQPLTRAAAAKILVLTKMKDADVQAITDITYADIPAGAWFRPYAEAARRLGIINAAPAFNGERPVKKAEFLKMLFSAVGADTNAYDEITLPLAPDVSDVTAWFYKPMRYAISTSLIQVEPNGKLEPEHALTRSEAAQLLYRYAMYQASKRTQALLSEEESELMNVLDFMEKHDLAQAEFASARALIAARGAHASTSTVPLVQGAVKTAEAFRSLVRGYKAGTEGKLDDVLALAKEAWTLADRAKQISPSLLDLSSRVQTVAKGMADQARALKAQP